MGSVRPFQNSLARFRRPYFRLWHRPHRRVGRAEVELSDLVPLLGVVPVPAGVGDQEPVAVDEGVVDGDDALVAVAGSGILLEQLQSSLIEALGVPGDLGEEAVEAGLVGGVGERLMDAEDGLALGDEEPGEVLGEMAALAVVGEEVAVSGHGVANHGGEYDNPWHDQMLRTPTAPEEIRVGMRRFYLF